MRPFEAALPSCPVRSGFPDREGGWGMKSERVAKLFYFPSCLLGGFNEGPVCHLTCSPQRILEGDAPPLQAPKQSTAAGLVKFMAP